MFLPSQLLKIGSDKMFERELDFKNIKFPTKLELITELKKKRIASTLALLVMKTDKNIQSICLEILSKTC